MAKKKASRKAAAAKQASAKERLEAIWQPCGSLGKAFLAGELSHLQQDPRPTLQLAESFARMALWEDKPPGEKMKGERILVWLDVVRERMEAGDAEAAVNAAYQLGWLAAELLHCPGMEGVLSKLQRHAGGLCRGKDVASRRKADRWAVIREFVAQVQADPIERSNHGIALEVRKRIKAAWDNGDRQLQRFFRQAPSVLTIKRAAKLFG